MNVFHACYKVLLRARETARSTRQPGANYIEQTTRNPQDEKKQQSRALLPKPMKELKCLCSLLCLYAYTRNLILLYICGETSGVQPCPLYEGWASCQHYTCARCVCVVCEGGTCELLLNHTMFKASPYRGCSRPGEAYVLSLDR